ncbi:MAG: tRNA (adenosine(37)-N6)-threonylcarbamoyltransferase complex transferase subunit TsaD [Candidatus Margulisbacteria bacterium]|nr:tRNA (adenosine(37)-N6)-threonylcarbamoyltransferase complex transferase subunit TsaD [Candidatus Margulisiibacteriota bacterium]
MITIGIESSCDETSIGIIENGRKVLANIISSQIKFHKKYGGVVPEMASRLHVLKIIPVLEEAQKKAGIVFKNINLIAATQGPGLLGALSTGFTAGKTLAYTLDLPFIGVNHIEGHIYANLCDEEKEFVFPALALIASGGHTQLILIKKEFKYQLISNTLDDAIGEAFDKSARVIGLGYPGGQIIDRLAKEGDKKAFKFPSVKTPAPLDFSFSGLKTAVIRLAKEYNLVDKPKDSQIIKDFCASLQNKLIQELVQKTFLAAEQFQVKHIIVAGGVSANSLLREEITKRSGYEIALPALKYCTDNGAMIASAGYYRYKKGFSTPLSAKPFASFSDLN